MDKPTTDINQQPIGAPYRSGNVVIENGKRLSIKDYLIELIIPAQATPTANYSFSLGMNGFLLNAYYWNMEFYSAATLPKSPISGNPVVTQTMLDSMFVTLIDNVGFTFWNLKPARSLQTINDTATVAGNTIVSGMAGTQCNWTNSVVQFADATTIAANTAFSILFSVGFTLNANWQEDGLGTRDISKSAT